MRHVSAEGLALLKQWEGLRLDAYRDVGGVWTIGYGHTGGVMPGERITEAEAEHLLRDDLGWAEGAVHRLVNVKLTDNQHAALVSFVFNVGEGAFAKSTLLRKLNAGDYAAVPAELARWNKAGGQVVQGLVNRRAAEAGLWAKGSFVTSTSDAAPKPSTPPVLTKETISWGATVLASLGAALSGSGPVQWALAAVIVAGAAVGGYLFLRARRAA